MTTRTWNDQQAKSARCWTLGAVALSLVAAVALLLVPVYASATPSGITGRRATDVIGGRALLFLVPVALSALPLLVAGAPRKASTLAATVLLGAFCLLTLPSVGIFLIPSAVCLLVAFTRLLTR
ncbi:hypothetical protein [Streptosporangium carneum]|uniref:Uncharacterized protein n=1 Tax=Streptosporangium carneum TaxID=47481 RepID=A0A9W6I064_9ACTN|nr:hypothetical protein [Streptosporangium carneum]GLK08849.1 hypothetical protein GCM10017600_22540 [Streptosporangium carneum]